MRDITKITTGVAERYKLATTDDSVQYLRVPAGTKVEVVRLPTPKLPRRALVTA